jgi:hypothetical protein
VLYFTPYSYLWMAYTFTHVCFRQQLNFQTEVNNFEFLIAACYMHMGVCTKNWAFEFENNHLNVEQYAGVMNVGKYSFYIKTHFCQLINLLQQEMFLLSCLILCTLFRITTYKWSSIKSEFARSMWNKNKLISWIILDFASKMTVTSYYRRLLKIR